MIKIAKILLRILLRLLYRVQVHGLEHYHQAGKRVVIIANHSSLLDGILLYAWLPETPTFAINTQIASRRLFRPFLWFVDLFVMDPTNPLSIKSMIHFIRSDRKAVIFPEGRITVTGSLMKIYEGPGLVADKSEAMILPISIEGAQYSPLSYLRGITRIAWLPKITMRLLAPAKINVPNSIHGHARRRAIAREMQQLMLKLYYTGFDYRRTVYAAFLEAARLHGMSRRVLEDINREPLNYRQLIVRVRLLAGLLNRETRPADYVGMMLPNVNGAVITFLALQSGGRVPAMLNYSAGTGTVAAACRTAGLKLVITSRKFVDAANLQETVEALSGELRVLYLEDLRERLTPAAKLGAWLAGRFPATEQRRARRLGPPDAPAVILFTSGSEGVPKGVVLSHANLLSNFAQVRCCIDFRSTDRLFCCLPLFHSFGLNAGCLMPLLAGSSVFLYPTPLHYRMIPELIYELGATILFATNTFLKGYARYANQFDFFTLRYVVAGAERLQEETRQLWDERFRIHVFQGYGVTEASPVVATNTPLVHRSGTVGRILPGMECRLEPVPGLDHGGHLVIRGPNVMLGYLLASAPGTIVPPRAGGESGWHDTGDIASIDDDGFVRILGRAKRFAKIGGEMVSLAVLEDVASAAWPKHLHAAVSLPDERKGEKIVLITTNREASRRTVQEALRARGHGELYIPRKVVFAEELPVLGTGKTDYQNLERLALAEDQDGSGWIKRIARLVTERPAATPEQVSNSEHPGNAKPEQAP